MCGLLVVISPTGRFSRNCIENGLSTLTHRGPDAAVVRLTRRGDFDVWMGHTRLSIIDLTDAANQPFSVPEIGDLVFNGEVYNHRDLRHTLERFWTFRTSSDTEVLAAGLSRDGEEFFTKVNGMFASVFFDAAKSEFIIGRDRLGKKPLYVYRCENLSIFASELKSIVALGLPLTIDELSLSYFRWLGYIPGELTIYKECRKFPAASTQRILLGEKIVEQPPKTYWDPLKACSEEFDGTYQEAQDEFLNLLDDATRIRLEADVPVGVFLSGGIDSSLVASSVARVQTKNTVAFTVVSTDPSFDESRVAEETARRLGLSLQKLVVAGDSFERLSGRLIEMFDEPFADQSAVPTMAISQEASKHVKVVLTGDGGDETFCGYPWFSYPDRLYRYRPPFSNVAGVNRALHWLLDSPISNAGLWAVATASGMKTNNLDVKKSFCHDLLDAQSPLKLYDTFQCAENYRLLSREDRERLGDLSIFHRVQQWHPSYSWACIEHRSTPEKLAIQDLLSYLRDDVLVKVDRCTMAFGLEARSPLLDYRMIEFGLRIPKVFKIHGGTHKRLLRDALKTRLDGRLSSLPKKGFGVPLPANLPRARSPRGRWVKWVEDNWRKRWRQEKPATLHSE